MACPVSQSRATSTAVPPAMKLLMNSRRLVIRQSWIQMLKAALLGNLIAPLLLPLRIIFIEQVGRSIRVPAVAVSALVFYLGDIVLNAAVAPCEDRTVRPDLIEACPERPGRR